jgi:hypothetical protein
MAILLKAGHHVLDKHQISLFTRFRAPLVRGGVKIDHESARERGFVAE